MRPPRVSVITFASYICCIYALKFGQYWTLFCVANSSVPKRLIYSFCSSDRGFASDFLQTPPHDGRPCLRLTVPTAKPVADFHRQVITRAERTTKKGLRQNSFCRNPFLEKLSFLIYKSSIPLRREAFRHFFGLFFHSHPGSTSCYSPFRSETHQIHTEISVLHNKYLSHSIFCRKTQP